MALDLDGALSLNAQALQFRIKRAEVLASNLANVNTPGYLAKDITFKGVYGQITTDRLASDSEYTSAALYRMPQQNSSDNNTSEMGVEQAHFAQNKMDFQMSLTFLNMKLSGIRKVLEAS